MNSQKGSAILIVLMVLGVIGMMGVALMIQSRLDLQFSSSVRNYDRMFSAADGAAALGVRFLQQWHNELRSSTATAYYLDQQRVDGSDPCRYSITSDTATCPAKAKIVLPAGLNNCTVTIFRERFVAGSGSDPSKVYYRVRAEATSSSLGKVFFGGGQGSPASSTVEVVMMDRF